MGHLYTNLKESVELDIVNVLTDMEMNVLAVLETNILAIMEVNVIVCYDLNIIYMHICIPANIIKKEKKYVFIISKKEYQSKI